MSRKSLLLFAILPLLKAGLVLPALAAVPVAPRYTITDLGTLPGGKYSAALAINDAGQVVGWSGTRYSMPYAKMDNQAVLWEGGTARALPVPDGDRYSSGTAINNEGAVLIGQSMNVAMSQVMIEPGDHNFALLWKRNVTTPLPLSMAVALNDRGQIVGMQEVTSGGVLTDPWFSWGPEKGRVPLGLPPYGSLSGLNDAGQIVGTRNDAVTHAFLYDHGKVTDLPTPPGFKQTDACGINDQGQIIFEAWPFVGECTLPIHSFLWDKGGLADLGPDTFARGINDQGQVVGAGGGRGGGFLWQRGHLYDALFLIPADAGWTRLSPNGINGHGQIVGEGEHNGERHAFLMTPAGVPPTVAAPPVPARLKAGATEPSTSAQAAGSPSSLADADVGGEFVLDKPTIVLGEPVWVTFRFTNRSAVPLHFLEAAGRGSVLRYEYFLTAYDAAGHEASPPPSRFMEISGIVRDVTVAPGESFQLRLFLPDWFTLHQPGTYALTCKRTLHFSRQPSGGQPVGPPVSVPAVHEDAPIAARLPLRILPTDAAALGIVIRKLGENTLAREGATRDEAAMSLSVIPDSRIVPILARLLARPAPQGGFDSEENFHSEDSKFFAIAGLSRFPSDTSANALLPVLNQSDEDLRRAAGNALKEMKYADRVLPQLRRELKSPSASARVAAIHAMGATQDVRAFTPLGKALQDRDANVRYEAAKTLGTLGDRRAVPILKSHFQDRDMTMRLACIKGLVPLKYPILTGWLTPIVQSYAFPAHQYPSLEAMLVMRQDCDNRAAPALASCLQFTDPRPSNGYNFFLIYHLEACANGPKYYYKWINGGGDLPAAVENNRKILASIKTWLLTQSGF